MSREYALKDLFGCKDLRSVIYVVISNDEVIQYVGMARVQCVADRMSRHIGDIFARDRASTFSRLLFKNHPQYFDWRVEVFTIAEVAARTGKKYDCLPCAERGLYDFAESNGGAPSGNAKRPSDRCEG